MSTSSKGSLPGRGDETKSQLVKIPISSARDLELLDKAKRIVAEEDKQKRMDAAFRGGIQIHASRATKAELDVWLQDCKAEHIRLIDGVPSFYRVINLGDDCLCYESMKTTPNGFCIMNIHFTPSADFYACMISKTGKSKIARPTIDRNPKTGEALRPFLPVIMQTKWKSFYKNVHVDLLVSREAGYTIIHDVRIHADHSVPQVLGYGMMFDDCNP